MDQQHYFSEYTVDDLRQFLEDVKNKQYHTARTVPCNNGNNIIDTAFGGPSKRGASACIFRQQGKQYVTSSVIL